MAHSEMRPSVVRLIVLLSVIGASTISVRGSTPPPSPPNEGQQIGKILSVRKVLENRYVGSRYPQIHYYLLYFAHTALNTRLLYLMRSMIYFRRRTKMSLLSSKTRASRCELRRVGRSRPDLSTKNSVNRVWRLV
jgi:hypothetical protein